MYLFSKMKLMKKKEPPSPAPFTILSNLYHTLPPSAVSYKVDFVCLFLIKF